MTCDPMPTLKQSLTLCMGAALGVVFGVAEAATNDTSLCVSERGWDAFNGQQHSLLAGGAVWIHLPRSLSVSATYLDGKYHTAGDTEALDDYQIVLAKQLYGTDLGLGFRYLAINTTLRPGWHWDTSIPNEEAERNADIYGPLLYAGVQRPVGRWPLAWSLAGSWMFKDFGDFNHLGYDGSQYTLEGLLILNVSRLRMAAGYRFERFQHLPSRGLNEERFSRDELDGVVAMAVVRF